MDIGVHFLNNPISKAFVAAGSREEKELFFWATAIEEALGMQSRLQRYRWSFPAAALWQTAGPGSGVPSALVALAPPQP